MKRSLCLMMLGVSLAVSSQEEISVISFKQSSSDISARTNQRDDTKGVPCALVKVQFPMRDVLFEGDIMGDVAFKTNEYWVYMPEQTSRLEVKSVNCKPLIVDFAKHGIGSVESKGTYELCLLKKEKNASQLYNDGMVALAKNDIITASDNLQKASDAGYAPAAYQLGVASIVPFDKNFDEDPNSQESYQEAYNYYVKAAKSEYAEAQVALAKLLLDHKNGYSSELSKITIDPKFEDFQNIWSLIKDAAKQGNVEAQWMMISDNNWCEENSTKGNAIAEFGMGYLFDTTLDPYEYPMIPEFEKSSDVEDYQKAAYWYEKAAGKGLAAAQWRLGDLYAQGLGVEKSLEKAIALRLKAASQGYYMYEYEMAIMYAYGEYGDYQLYSMYNTELGEEPWGELSPDAEKADYWLRKVSHKEWKRTEKENIETNGLFASVADMIAHSFVEANKYEKAIYWYQREIEMGYRDAYYLLGTLYLDGKGIKKDCEKARELFEIAISDDEHFGDGYSGQYKSKALYNLGIMYRDGLGVEANKEKAKDYLHKAVSEGDEDAKRELERIERL